MTLRTRLGGVLCCLAVAGAGVTACGDSDENGSATASKGSVDRPVLIGIVAARTGTVAPVDNDPARGALLAAAELNAAGGVLGQPLETRWLDNKSDAALGARSAEELLAAGATALILPCDFDTAAPPALAAQAAGVPAVSMCASDPKMSDLNTIGEFGFSLGTGTDVKGAMAAEWAFRERGWRNAFILRDDSIEYSRSQGKFFEQSWKDLGGNVVGVESFVGGEDTNVRPQVAALRQVEDEVDVVVLASWPLPGPVAVREIRNAGIDLPIVHPGASIDGQLLTDVVPDVSNLYSFPYACLDPCRGGEQPSAVEFANAFADRYGSRIINTYPLLGYDTMTVLADAIEAAGSTDGAAIVKALEEEGGWQTTTGEVEFSARCHKPIRRPHPIVEYQDGKAKQIGTFRATEIADIGTESGCFDE